MYTYSGTRAPVCVGSQEFPNQISRRFFISPLFGKFWRAVRADRVLVHIMSNSSSNNSTP